MATWAARKLRQIAQNVRRVIGIEMLAAAQGIDFHRPLKTSAILEEIHAKVNKRDNWSDVK